jgi:hypothetical protein
MNLNKHNQFTLRTTEVFTQLLSDNAKKQKKKKQLEKEETKLAPQAVLNQQEVKEVEAEEKQHKDKVVVVVGADGQSYIQREDQDKPPNTEDKDYDNHVSKDKTFTQSFSCLQQQLEQNNLIEESTDQTDNESKDQGSGDLDYQNLEQEEIIDKSYQVSTNNNENRLNILPDDKSISTFNISADILPFEFSWSFKELRHYSAPLHPKIGDNGRVWVSGLIDKNTAKVISHHFGRLNQQQRQPLQDDEGIDCTDRGSADEL